MVLLRVIRSLSVLLLLSGVFSFQDLSPCQVENYYRNCFEIKNRWPDSVSGIYNVWPVYFNQPFQVFCDMETDGGGWTVIQRRMKDDNGQENFYRGWQEYKDGFGYVNREYYLGNDKIFALTNQGLENELRVDLEDFEGEKRYAKYSSFLIESERMRYKLRISGYSGNAGDAMKVHDNRNFDTFDKSDPDARDEYGVCAEKYKGGWWYGQGGCHHANLNGVYLNGITKSYADGINWYEFKGHYYSLKSTAMKIRPRLN